MNPVGVTAKNDLSFLILMIVLFDNNRLKPMLFKFSDCFYLPIFIVHTLLSNNQSIIIIKTSSIFFGIKTYKCKNSVLTCFEQNDILYLYGNSCF